MPSYRHKHGDPYCEFITRDRGVADHRALNIEVVFTLYLDGAEYAPGVEFKTALKALPRGAWHYDGEGHWYILPQYLEQMQTVAVKLYGHVYLTEGFTTTDVVSGSEQKGLFG